MVARSDRGESKPGGPVASPAETVHSHSLAEESFASHAVVGQKICCACGKDVAHEERFKDKKGRYWCYACGVADSRKKHPGEQLKCPDCGGSFASQELVEHEGHHLCQSCVDKRIKSAKREIARKAAASEAARESERKRRQFVWSSLAVIAAVVGLLTWIFLGT